MITKEVKVEEHFKRGQLICFFFFRYSQLSCLSDRQVYLDNNNNNNNTSLISFVP